MEISSRVRGFEIRGFEIRGFEILGFQLVVIVNGVLKTGYSNGVQTGFSNGVLNYNNNPLSNNTISSLPTELVNVTSLGILDLSATQISVFPSEIGNAGVNRVTLVIFSQVDFLLCPT